MKEDMEKKLNELFSGEYSSIEGLEILNTFANSHKIDFTVQDLEDIAHNFKEYKSVYTPNVKISHTEQQKILKELFKTEDIELGEELPALGYIKDMKVKVTDKGASLLADIEKIPSKLVDKIFGNKMFKTISPEVIMNFRETKKKFMKAIALTNNPSMKHVWDVHMSEALSYGGDFTMIDKENDMSDEFVKKEELDASLKTFGEKLMDQVSGFFKKKEEDKTPVDDKDKGKKKDDDKDKDATLLSEDKETITKLTEKVNELSILVTDQNKEAKENALQLAEVQKSTRKEKVDAMLMKAKMSGIPTFVTNHFAPVLMSEYGDAEIKMTEMVDEKPVDVKTNFSEVIEKFFLNFPKKDRVDLGEQTSTYLNEPGDDDDKKFKSIMTRAKEIVKEDASVNMNEALAQAGIEYAEED